MHKVSVVMPVYNAENTVQRAIKSVIDQTYRNLELIVVDDGSTDNTGKLLDIIEKTDSRINIIHIQNGGVSNARNIAIDRCSGMYITFIDSDDMMLPSMIEKMVNVMTTDVDMVCCGYTTYSPNGKVAFSQNPEDKCWNRLNLYEGIGDLQNKKAFNVLWNKLFRLSVIKDNALKMDRNIKMGEDFLFIKDYLNVTQGSLQCISDALYYYVLSPGGAQAIQNAEGSLSRRIEQLYKLVPLYEKLGYPLDTIFEEQLRCLYTSLLESNNIKESLSAIFKDDKCKKLIKMYKPNGLKYGIFLALLRTRNDSIVSFAVKVFKIYKKKRGKSYDW